MKLFLPLIVVLCSVCVSPLHSGPRNSFAGRYEGIWGKPRGLQVRDADTNEIIEGGGNRTAIMLKVPAGSGRRNGTIDARGAGIIGPEPGPKFARLLTDFGEPEIRRGGKKVIFDAVVDWKLLQAGIPFDNIPGSLRIKISKRGSKYSIKRGNVQLFIKNTPPQQSVKYTGQIRALKQ